MQHKWVYNIKEITLTDESTADENDKTKNTKDLFRDGC